MFDIVFRIAVYIMFIAGLTCLGIGLMELGFHCEIVALPLILTGLFMAAMGAWGIDIDAKDRYKNRQYRSYRK